ncbi:PQQ-binding-like beta-propeller repeat protein [Streptomyces murinus]|uniref:outer membrane protein assembly factor BamB family protein n=1 Tax=Streptomyces murinus TaxID=33900 RepID=UPI000A1E1EED|nr:PQQ-binding-like beta-propeller repeat protein [Streptomyces murinus]WDO05851.1 PQQ-binding-like beta-propeller repeat protein [Streptomyces murinus]
MSFGPPPSAYTQSALAADESRNRRRRRLLGVIAAAVAVVLCVGAGLIWFHSSGDGKSRTDAKTVRQFPDDVRDNRVNAEKAPVSPEGQPVVDHAEEGLTKKVSRFAPGVWATDKLVARAVGNRVEGYKIGDSMDSDNTAWTLHLDGSVCAVSRDTTVDGRTAVVVQPAHGICDQVLMVDLNTGRQLWKEKIPAADLAYVTNTNIALTRGVVAVAWGHGSAAYDMKSGQRLWNTTLATSQCYDSGYAGGRTLLALVTCKKSGESIYRVEKLEPRTGKVVWRYPVSEGIQDVFLPSSDPPVIAVAAGDLLVTDLITLDPKSGERLATISLKKYEPYCDPDVMGYFGVVDKCDGIVVGRDRIFVRSKDDNDLFKPANHITAFDVRRGTAVATFQGREVQPVLPIRMNGDDLIIYRSSLDDIQPAAVVDWNPRTGKETPYLLFHLPEDDHQLGDPELSETVYEHGRVYFAPRGLALGDDPKDPVISVLGVGTAGLKH